MEGGGAEDVLSKSQKGPSPSSQQEMTSGKGVDVCFVFIPAFGFNTLQFETINNFCYALNCIYISDVIQ